VVRLVVFGRQGAGKGTQCALLSEHYGAPHISTGEMLRAAVAAGSEIGVRAKKYMDAGALVPDDVLLGAVEERLVQPDAATHGFLLDGFPRTRVQAEALVAVTPVDVAVDIQVPEDVVIERMLGRGREDDTPEAIRARLDAYVEQTVPVIEWFADKGLLVEVGGVGGLDEVRDRLIAAIDARLEG
jgi:adenylate kinase